MTKKNVVFRLSFVRRQRTKGKPLRVNSLLSSFPPLRCFRRTRETLVFDNLSIRRGFPEQNFVLSEARFQSKFCLSSRFSSKRSVSRNYDGGATNLSFIPGKVEIPEQKQIVNLLQLTNSVRQHVQKRKLLRLDDKVLTTVSGGQDSVCSLFFLYLLQTQFCSRSKESKGYRSYKTKKIRWVLKDTPQMYCTRPSQHSWVNRIRNRSCKAIFSCRILIHPRAKSKIITLPSYPHSGVRVRVPVQVRVQDSICRKEDLEERTKKPRFVGAKKQRFFQNSKKPLRLTKLPLTPEGFHTSFRDTISSENLVINSRFFPARALYPGPVRPKRGFPQSSVLQELGSFVQALPNPNQHVRVGYLCEAQAIGYNFVFKSLKGVELESRLRKISAVRKTSIVAQLQSVAASCFAQDAGVLGLLSCNHFWQKGSFFSMRHTAKLSFCFGGLLSNKDSTVDGSLHEPNRFLFNFVSEQGVTLSFERPSEQSKLLLQPPLSAITRTNLVRAKRFSRV